MVGGKTGQKKLTGEKAAAEVGQKERRGKRKAREEAARGWKEPGILGGPGRL